MADGALKGYTALSARLKAISLTSVGPKLMRTLGLATVAEAKHLVPRKTGNLARTIHLAHASASSATIVASAAYAGFVERGTGPHEITPRARKALRWAATSAGARLTGTPRRSTVRGGNGGVLFAKKVHHPGTKPHPYLLPGAKKAVESAGIIASVVDEWNGAA